MSDKKSAPTVEPSEAVRAFMTPGPSEVFAFKRWESPKLGQKPELVEKNVRVKLLPLTETHEALAAAQRYAKQLGEVPGEHRDIYEEAKAVEVVWRSMVQVDEHERRDGTRCYLRMFTSPEHLRSSFTEPEIAQVLNMIAIVRAKYGQIEGFTEDEIDTWTARLSDALLGEYFLSVLDSSLWATLILVLAREVKSLRDEVGRPVSMLPDSSESAPQSSPTGTGSFTELPAAFSTSDEEPLPTDKLLTQSEALQRGKRMKQRSKGGRK